MEAYFADTKIPLVFVVYTKEMLEREMEGLREKGFEPIKIKHEKIP